MCYQYLLLLKINKSAKNVFFYYLKLNKMLPVTFLNILELNANNTGKGWTYQSSFQRNLNLKQNNKEILIINI